MTNDQLTMLADLQRLDAEEKRAEELKFARKRVADQVLALDWIGMHQENQAPGIALGEWFPRFGFQALDEHGTYWSRRGRDERIEFGDILQAIDDWARRMEPILRNEDGKIEWPNLCVGR